MGSTSARKKTKIGFDYIHSIVDDHTRIAYSEIHADEKGETCAGFFERAIEFYAGHGITIERVMTDNHWSYKNTRRLTELITRIGAKHKFIRPHCPWQNGKVERFNRTLQTEWPTVRFSSPTMPAQQLCQTSSTATTIARHTPNWTMTPLEIVQQTSPIINEVGNRFYFDPDTLAAGQGAGPRWLPLLLPGSRRRVG